MKHKLLYVIGILFFCVLLIIFIYKNNTKLDNSKQTYDIKIIEKCSFKEKENNWVYYMCVDYRKDDETKKITSATFGGINMKYSELDDHYIEVIDDTTNRVVDKIKTEYVSLANGQSTREEMKRINLFLESKKFNKNIELKDLKDLETEYISKETLVEMYNDAFNSEEKEVGQYITKSFAGAVNSEYLDNYKYQIVYIIDYGNVSKLNIELIYKDGTFLTDKINNNTATADEKDMYITLEKIENIIIKDNDFLAGIQKNTEKNNFDFNELNRILKKLNSE